MKWMDQQDLFPEEPGANARNGDPETSHKAAASVQRIRQSQNYILQVFKEYGPLSDEELIRKYRSLGLPLQSDSGIRTRRSELVEYGLIVDSGKRSLTSSRRQTILWRAV